MYKFSTLCILLCTASLILANCSSRIEDLDLDSSAKGETVDFAPASCLPRPAPFRHARDETPGDRQRGAEGRVERGKWTVSPGESAYPVSTRASTCTRLLFTADPLMPRDERTAAIASERGMRKERGKKRSVAAEKAERKARRARSGARFRGIVESIGDRAISAESTLSCRV
jgi:hypothetical protein